MTPEEPPVNFEPTSASPPEALGAPAISGVLPVAPERDPFWGYGDLLWFFGLAIPSMLAAWVVEWFAMKLFKLEVVSLTAGMVVLYGMLFGSLRMMFRVVYDRPFWRSLGWTPIRLPATMVMLSGMATAVLVALASMLIRTPTGDNQMTQLLETRADVLVMGVLAITLAPLCEELAFRGFLQPLLVRSLGAAPGILLAAIPFGLLHFHEYGNSWRHVLIISMAGVAFGCMRHATGSTKASALMHAAYNSLIFIALMTEKRILPHLW
ncbi:MAG: lysostaphin resistance A-like protein [Bryobacteraceae bacterium]